MLLAESDKVSVIHTSLFSGLQGLISLYKWTMLWAWACIKMCTTSPISPHPLHPSYLPQVSCVSDGSRLQFVQQQRDSLKGADPGSLRDPLSCADPITQTRNCTGAQTHLHTKHRTDNSITNLFMSMHWAAVWDQGQYSDQVIRWSTSVHLVKQQGMPAISKQRWSKSKCFVKTMCVDFEHHDFISLFRG